MQSMSENDFECFASTGVNTPETMFPNLALRVRAHARLPQCPWPYSDSHSHRHLVKLAPVGSARSLKPERLRNMETSLERGPLLERFVSGRVALSLQNYHLNQRFSLTA